MALSMSEGRKRGLRTLLPIGLILALAAAGGASLAVLLKNAQPDAMSALEPAADRLDFGEVWENPNFSILLPITNHRGQDIEITRFQKTCNCSEIEPSSLTIPARQTREVRLILDLTAKKPAEAAAAVRDFEVSLSPEIPGDRHSIWWTIRGRVRTVMKSTLPKIDFDKVSELSRSLPVKRVTVVAQKVVHKLTASCSSPNFAVTVEKRASAAANLFDLVVAMTKVPPRGASLGSVTVVPESSDGSRLPSRQLDVNGRIVGDIDVSPANVFFGGCPVGSTKSETVAFRSLTGQAFEITRTRCEGEGLSMERQSSTNNGGFAIELKQKIGWRGEHNSKVFVSVSRPGASEEEIVVLVSYSGF